MCNVENIKLKSRRIDGELTYKLAMVLFSIGLSVLACATSVLVPKTIDKAPQRLTAY